MVLVLWEVDVILRKGYGIQGQNYVALLQGSEKSAGIHSRNLILDIQCFKVITLNVISVVKWLSNQISNPVAQDLFLGAENTNLNLTPDFNQENKKARWFQDFLVWHQEWTESFWIFCELLKIESVLWNCNVGLCWIHNRRLIWDENFMAL